MKFFILRQYLDRQILPTYSHFDRSHRQDHAILVAKFSTLLAEKLAVRIDIAYTAAIFHDTGLWVGRKNHHIESGIIVRSDRFLKLFFKPHEIEIIAEAVEDHRNYSEENPRNIYGMILSDADRCDYVTLKGALRRTWNFRIEKQKSQTDYEIFKDMYSFIHRTFVECGLNFKLDETNKLLKADLENTRILAKNVSNVYEIFLQMRLSNDLSRVYEFVPLNGCRYDKDKSYHDKYFSMS